MTATPIGEALPSNRDLISFILTDDWNLIIQVSPIPVIALCLVAVAIWLALKTWTGRRLSTFEIDGAELGIGDSRISFKPNDTDRQVAYSIWVELSTRKIGLPINIEDDVIVEIYNSWYAFFGVTRNLIKDIPVSKVRDESTSKIVSLSIDVLNEGLRPHLTKWQARFRHWYELEIKKENNAPPQEIQKRYPKYDELSADLLKVNTKLIKYRSKMNEIVTIK